MAEPYPRVSEMDNDGNIEQEVINNKLSPNIVDQHDNENSSIFHHSLSVTMMMFFRVQQIPKLIENSSEDNQDYAPRNIETDSDIERLYAETSKRLLRFLKLNRKMTMEYYNWLNFIVYKL